MKKVVLLFCALLAGFAALAQGQPRQSFDNLAKSRVNDYLEIWYDTATTKFVGADASDSIDSVPRIVRDYYEEETAYYYIGESKLDGKTSWQVCFFEQWLVLFREGLAEPISVFGTGTWVIPGNGALYNDTPEGFYPRREKYEIAGDKITKVEQPLQYIGLKSQTLNPVTVYQTAACEKVVAKIPAGYEIEVVLVDQAVFDKSLRTEEGPDDGYYASALYFVRTSFGLCGWESLKVGQYIAVDVEGLMYYGS
jgi:hypothetical protein